MYCIGVVLKGLKPYKSVQFTTKKALSICLQIQVSQAMQTSQYLSDEVILITSSYQPCDTINCVPVALCGCSPAMKDRYLGIHLQKDIESKSI